MTLQVGDNQKVIEEKEEQQPPEITQEANDACIGFYARNLWAIQRAAAQLTQENEKLKAELKDKTK